MTNADIVLAALKAVEKTSNKTLFHAADVMWQVRRDGYQMTTDRARGILRVLSRNGQVETVRDGRFYFFRSVK